MDSTAANYRYWREHGAEWHTEYDWRKKYQVCYHNQEIMIADYLRHSAPARVLEFGCGIGRHLRYLKTIPGLEVHGYDQSPQMVAGMQAWAEPDWLESHVRTGAAVGRLPYADGAFDVVFTAEVLVHVRPEHLASILAELVRVARWQVVHFETAADFPLDAGAHDGCWYHDLSRAYSGKGLSCETLPAGYRAHRPHRVVLDASRPVPEASHVLPTLLRQLETNVQGTLAGWAAVGDCLQCLATVDEQARAAAAEPSDPVARANKHCELISARIRAAEEAIRAAGEAKTRAEQANAALLAELAALRGESNQVRAELARLESSLGHRVLQGLRRMPGFRLLRRALQATF